MTTPAAELAFDLRADLGEGPVWDAEARRLHCVDITAAKIHACDPSGGSVRTLAAPGMVGCIALRASGGLVAALANGVWAVDPARGEFAPLLCPPEHDAARCRFNDGKCDPQGRLWTGTMGLKSERGLGALYCFPSAAECRRELDAVSVSNGLAWSPDGATLYFIDSPTRRVDRFDFDGDTGRIRNRRTAIVLPPGSDVPDGCTMDADGMLWIAHWGGGRVTRWNPHTGELLGELRVPAPNVTSCTFGGAQLDTLYITTARRGLDAAALAAFPQAGGVFACRPGVSGLPAHAFAG